MIRPTISSHIDHSIHQNNPTQILITTRFPREDVLLPQKTGFFNNHRGGPFWRSSWGVSKDKIQQMICYGWFSLAKPRYPSKSSDKEFQLFTYYWTVPLIPKWFSGRWLKQPSWKKYARQIGSSPQVRLNIKVFETTKNKWAMNKNPGFFRFM